MILGIGKRIKMNPSIGRQFRPARRDGILPPIVAGKSLRSNRQTINTNEHELRTTNRKQRILGFTLIEVLVVLIIISTILAIGLTLTSTANKQFGFPAMRGAIVSLLRYTRSQAVIEKSSSCVIFNINNRQAYSLSNKNIRLWHMEDIEDNKTTGAFGYDGKVSEQVKLTTEGRYGNALLFNGAGLINCGSLTLRGNETALTLESWIYPISQTDQVIISMKDDYNLMITKNLEIVCNFGALKATSPPNLIQLEKWANIRIVYETKSPFLYQSPLGDLKIYLNNVLITETSGINNTIKFNSLTISSETQPFYGKIDEVKIDVLVEGEKQELQPPNIVITSNLAIMDNEMKISFDYNGNLITQLSDNSSVAVITFLAPLTKESFSLIIDSFGMVKIQ